METYHLEDASLYSGYDEYAGIFGPLQAPSSLVSRSRGRMPPGRRGFSSSRNLEISSRFGKGRKLVPRDFDRRAKFLAKRKAKRVLHPLYDDSDGNEDLQDKENELTSPTHGLQRQVWLPTRNFTFRQRAGKLDTRAIARLDLEKIAATTDIETIQRHLENLAFADVTLDDVQHYSDAYFLKLFQIAQYLMHVQDSLVDHSEGLENQCEQLVAECQQLESENGQHETEIASLKREIRQKQRTMATLELMLLNASASNRISGAQENAARDANVLLDDLLTNRVDPTTAEEGSIAKSVSCVLCEKRFVSAEYLLRHQQRRHREEKGEKKEKRKEKSGLSSGPDSDSASNEKRSKKPEEPAPLPKEVVDALEEKNILAKQLMTLQEEIRHDQDARDRQRQQLESQQCQISSRVEQYMEKLQTALVEIDKKQEATKQDLRQYTHEAIARLQVEAANAELLRIQAQKTSRAGRIESDDDGSQAAAKIKSEEVRWSEKIEKLMDSFLRAQAEKQHEIDVLEQESNKLWLKYTKLKRRKPIRPEPTMILTDITALDANLFGTDHGEVVDIETPMPINAKPAYLLEDKVVQTDEEDDNERYKREPHPDKISEEVQTDSEAKATSTTAVVVPPIRVEVIERKSSPPPIKQPDLPCLKEDKAPIAPPPTKTKEAIQPDSGAKFQQAAHKIGKVVLGFLTRRALAKTSNWSIAIEISSLESALTDPELDYVRRHYDRQIRVQVEEAMTANNLRVLIARMLSGKDELEAANGVVAFDSDDREITVTATMTYHRVLLHDKRTKVELYGDMPVHELKNAIEVEIIPFYEEAATKIGEAIESHAVITDHVEDIRRASLTLPSSKLLILQGNDDEAKSSVPSEEAVLAHIVQLQALVRQFLARKKVELMKIDLLVDARLVKMKELNTGPSDLKALDPSWMSLDPVLSLEYAKVEQRLAQILRSKLQEDFQQDPDNEGTNIGISTAKYDKHVAQLESEQQALPEDVLGRIQLLTQRLPPVAIGEYNRKQSEAEQTRKSRVAGAAKIHRAVQVEVVRKRLRRLLEGEISQNAKRTEINSIEMSKVSFTTNALLSSWLTNSKESRRTSDKSLGSFDPREIDQLANAYEEGKSPVEIPKFEVSGINEHTPPTAACSDAVESNEEEKPQIPQPLTPQAVPNDAEPADEAKPVDRPGTPSPYAEANRELIAEAGRSPRPNPGVHVISPFSKTPLISRRAAARRGTGFDNAR
ncbi:unnamed protein product [Phytophthora fragariaefolia]|uniref:Unnamed protein product n=1 Tax=Phytophthora fragariaefolia TaxID=1490495 RepID=A0A9W6TPF8_9STRA|nr:unnamed protein product [Phytophthora fragariaefolia]